MSKPTKKAPAAPRYTVQNCHFVNEAFKPDAAYMAAVQAVAEAAKANARAIEAVAERLAGPADNRVGLRIGGDQ